ncbi:MAG: PD40 domain-containing protein [Gemmatimonadaceae bacterium]|nr:PD40 domain-containing protein [Gemmatimonadaceae bacterium]
MRIDFLALWGAVLVSTACSQAPISALNPDVSPTLLGGTPTLISAAGGEVHFATVRQITFAGENAEAYFSGDGQWITFQATHGDHPCDQQWVMRADGSNLRRISDGRGKTTCGWFFPGSKKLLFASTSAHDAVCPVRPDPSKGYVWPLDRYDIYTVNRDGSELKRLTHNDVYTAESVLSPDGKRIVFTSLKDGDLDIYTMNVDGSNVRRLTNTPGYDGGAWWSPDGKELVYRSNHPREGPELQQYRDYLAQGLVRPSKVELFLMNADGSNQRQITNLGGANFGPSWTPDGKRIVFSSNYKNPRSGNFDLYTVNRDGSGLEQLTFDESFDGFPMFSPDGKKLIWASNRHANKPNETNLFIADWQ